MDGSRYPKHLTPLEAQALDSFVELDFRDGDIAQLLSQLGRVQLARRRPDAATETFYQAIQRARP